MRNPVRAAILLIEHQGNDAKPNAIKQVAAMRAAGDTVAEASWTEIFAAIADMEATESARRQAADRAHGRPAYKSRPATVKPPA